MRRQSGILGASRTPPRKPFVSYNLGHAYMNLPDIRDLDAAEAAYQRSLDLLDPSDARVRCGCIHQIGVVHHERFRDSAGAGRTFGNLLRHWHAARTDYLDALKLCPASAVTDRGPIHNQLGNLYAEVGQTESAREHLRGMPCRFSNRSATFTPRGRRGRTWPSCMRRPQSGRKLRTGQRNTLLRAQAYAKAALRDFQHYQGRCAADEAKAQGLLDYITQQLAKLPQ